MQDNWIKNIFEEAKQISLAPEEKEHLKENILHFVRNNQPLPEAVIGTQSQTKQSSPECPCLTECSCGQDCDCKSKTRYSHGIVSFSSRFALTMIVVLAAFCSSGLVWAAEKSLPGDPLYPVKVGFNEEFVSSFLFSSEERARWEVRRFERRIEEAEKLAAEMAISDKAKEDINGQFELRTREIKKEIEDLELNGYHNASAEVSSDLEASLRAHRDVLVLLEEQNRDYHFRINPITLKLSSIINLASDLRKQSQSKISEDKNITSESTVLSQKQSAEDLFQVVKTLNESINDQAVRSQVQATLDIVLSRISEGNGHMEKKEFGKAFVSFQQAVWNLNEAEVLIEMAREFDIRSNDVLLSPTSLPKPVPTLLNLKEVRKAAEVIVSSPLPGLVQEVGAILGNTPVPTSETIHQNSQTPSITTTPTPGLNTGGVVVDTVGALQNTVENIVNSPLPAVVPTTTVVPAVSEVINTVDQTLKQVTNGLSL